MERGGPFLGSGPRNLGCWEGNSGLNIILESKGKTEK